MAAPTKMSSGEERCGPLCQHPGCWHSTQAPHGSSNSYYLRYLSRLASRKSRKTRDGHRKSTSAGQKRSSLTADGLPTLKVQTLEQDHMTSGFHDNRKRTRAFSLPPVRTNSGSNEGSVYIGHSRSGHNKNVHFVQMHLEEEPAVFEDISDLVFSPVLVWKPGKHPHTRHTTHPPHTCTMLHVPLPSPHTPTKSPKPSRPLSRLTPSPLDPRTRAKSPLHLKRTDLTNVLPPEESNTEIVDKKVDGSYQRVTTAEAENFSYLGDIPRQFVAEIIQQLRSESTSNIERTLPVQSTMEMTTDNPPSTHIPASLTYDLSTKKISRTKAPPTPKTRTTSFSRELSKRPLEVLRKKAPDSTRLEPITESVKEGEKTYKPSAIDIAMIQPHASRSTVKPLDALIHRQPLSIEPVQKVEEEVSDEKQISPRRINLELGDLTVPQDNRYLGQKRSKSKILTPSYSSPRPFSEDSSIAVAKTPIAVTELRRVDSQRVLSSASPDFMLVGAHFAGDQLVLSDRGAQFVHQLTEVESDANLLQTVTERNGPDSTDVAEHDVVPTDNALLEKPCSGIRPPPSTAVEDVRPHLSAAGDVNPSILTPMEEAVPLNPTDESQAAATENDQHASDPLEHSDVPDTPEAVNDSIPLPVGDGTRAPPSTALEESRTHQHASNEDIEANSSEANQLPFVEDQDSIKNHQTPHASNEDIEVTSSETNSLATIEDQDSIELSNALKTAPENQIN